MFIQVLASVFISVVVAFLFGTPMVDIFTACILVACLGELNLIKKG